MHLLQRHVWVRAGGQDFGEEGLSCLIFWTKEKNLSLSVTKWLQNTRLWTGMMHFFNHASILKSYNCIPHVTSHCIVTYRNLKNKMFIFRIPFHSVRSSEISSYNMPYKYSLTSYAGMHTHTHTTCLTFKMAFLFNMDRPIISIFSPSLRLTCCIVMSQSLVDLLH